MKAIVDCNSFYCTCERLFRPELEHKPVAVLSNNDGCIISRTDEVKAIGVSMGVPYFQVKQVIDNHHISCFSSNYNLYGDLSWRVMETLRYMLGKENVEVYSIDEAFLHLEENNNYEETGLRLRLTVEEWTGIKVSVGIAPTKVLAKMANNIAKKNKASTNCVVVLDTNIKIQQALSNMPIEDVWGLGRQYVNKLKEEHAIFTALDLCKKKEPWARTYLGGVVGVRLLKELKGEATKVIEAPLIKKKMIASTRMFGTPATSFIEVKEALCSYTARAAEKLRRQRSAAGVLQAFVIPREANIADDFRHGPTISRTIKLHTPTADSAVLIKETAKLARQLFEPGRSYKKSGIMLSGLVPEGTIQANIFSHEESFSDPSLMEAIDNMNFSMRDDIVRFAATGLKRKWKMKQDLLSPRYTTRWKELCNVK